MGVIAAQVAKVQWEKSDAAFKLGYSAIEMTTSGAFFAQLAIGVLGVLVITTEYGTGMIRATFAAVPQRRQVLAAKALVFFLVALLVCVASSFVAFFVGQAVLGTYEAENLSASIGDPAALRVVVGAGVFVACMGLLGFALGAVLRNSAGAVTALFGLVFFLPIFSELLPAVVKDNVTRYLPSNAGAAIHRVVQTGGNGPDVLSPGAGLLVLCAWSLVALAIAAVIVQRRDA
jgi:ABC-type transport system involved in multi-copper enzyme maturation permease subunit